MTRTQKLNSEGLLTEAYADRLLDMIEIPQNGTVSMIILGYEDVYEMKVHFAPLTDEQLLDISQWWDNSDVHATVSERQLDAIKETAKRRWPEARVFRVPGCQCCNGVRNLLDYDCEYQP